MIILDRNIKANFIIRITEKKSGKSLVISLNSQEDNLKSLREKIKGALK